jgi:hypothetical protein
MIRRASGIALRLLAALAVAGCAAEPAQGPAPAGPPRPPYARFSGTTFEPSAVAYDAATERYLVFSDRDGIVYRYRLEGGALALPPGEHHRELRLPGGAPALKFEAITPLEDGRFIVMTAFDRPAPEFRRIVRFRFGLEGPVEGEPLAFPEAELRARLQVLDPGIAYFKVEGVAAGPGDATLLVAIRSVGESHKKKRDVVWIARLPRLADDRGYGAPDRLVRYDAGAAVHREEGASSLVRDRRGERYLLLTSYEDEGHPRSPAAHGGHLFALPAADLDAAAGAPDPPERPLPAPLRAFFAKCEGLALAPDGGALVVFDDDRDWKRTFAGYDQPEGLFTVVPAADLR